MKNFIYLFSFLILLTSCSETEKKKTEEKFSAQVTKKSQNHKEFYDNGNLKIEGYYNENGEKTGKWVSYFENGKKNSEANFSKGISHGYSMVWYPNGSVRYFGDYNKGEKVRKWVFYDETGSMAKEKDYSKNTSEPSTEN